MGAYEKKTSTGHKVLSIVGGILCVIFGFFLICNLTIIIKGSLNPDTPPSVLGTTPMVVQSGSMSGTIEVGDLIFVGKTQPEELKEGDIIAYMSGQVVVTHRIVEITTDENGGLLFTTQGDANNAPDQAKVSGDKIVGIYQARIPKMGDVAMFLQTPLGMVIGIGIPLVLFIIYDIIRRQRYANREQARTAEMEAELERLRAIAGESGEKE